MKLIKKMLSTNGIIRCLWFLAITLFGIYFAFGHKYKVIYNVGNSMAPTIKHGEMFVIERKSSLGEDWRPQRWDAVLVINVFDQGKEYISKRVVGLPGDKVEIINGKIFINNKYLEDIYGNGDISEGGKYNINEHETTVPEGYIWVIGDNREISMYGMFSIEDIVGLIIHS